jgi:hypothetical protein
MPIPQPVTQVCSHSIQHEYENINCPGRLVASSTVPAPARNKKKNHKKNRNMFTPTVGLLHQAMWPNPNK